jgi:hypothetical protein
MDFLKKKMKELLDDDDKKPEKKTEGESGLSLIVHFTNVRLEHKAPAQDSSHGAPAERGASDSFYGQSQQPGGHPPQQHQYPPQGQGYSPQGQGYPPQGQGYPQQGYSQQQPYGQGPPPVGPPAPMGAPPPMPPGWTQQWDQNSQRWYYVEQATGRTQWDPPAHLPPGPYAPPPTGTPYQAPGGHDERGLFGNTHGHQGHDYTPSGAATNEKEKKKDKDGHSTAMLAAAGIGGIAAGAWIGHELSTFYLSMSPPQC